MAIGIVSAAGGVGSLSIPFAMSAISHRYGLVQGFCFYLVVSAVMMGMALWRMGDRESREERPGLHGAGRA